MIKRVAWAICSLLLVALLFGCAEPSSEERLLGHWEKIVGILNVNKADAAKAAAELSAYLTANMSEMRDLAITTGRAAGSEVVKSASFIEREKKVRMQIVELENASSALLNDPAVKAALGELSGLSF